MSVKILSYVSTGVTSFTGNWLIILLSYITQLYYPVYPYPENLQTEENDILKNIVIQIYL